jgi:superfamily II DNA/RNA helicase
VLQPTLNLPVPCCAIFVMCVLAWLWQQERDAALHMFKSGHKNVLIATDVAARGLDVKVRRKCILMRALAHARTHARSSYHPAPRCGRSQ